MAASILPAGVVDALPEWARGWPAVAGAAVGLGAIAVYALRRNAAGGVNKYKPDMTGRVALVTGGNTGIGFEACKTLYQLGATVILAGRSAERIGAAVAKIKAGEGKGAVVPQILDLADRASVERCAADVSSRFDRLDLLVNNAGIMFTFGKDRTEGPDGFEEQFQTNVIGHVLLTEKLLPLLESTEGSPRVVNVASRAHRWAPLTMFSDLQSESWTSGASAYGISKLGNMLHARGLNKELTDKGSRVRCYSLHPGVVMTELLRNTDSIFIPVFRAISPLIAKTPLEGAQTTLHCCLAPDDKLTGGAYYSDCAETEALVSDRSLWTDKAAGAFLAAVREMAATGKPQATVPGAV